MKIKRLNDLAKIPTRGSEDAAGWDLYAAIDKPIDIAPHETVKIETGLAMEIPRGFFGALFPRSGIATKRGLRLANCVGVIDSDYRGNIIVPIHNDHYDAQVINPGERIAQLIVIPYFIDFDGFEEVDELDETERGDGGFGSTGRK